ncbi:amino acid-binding protein [Vitreoscilla massiliensis]|uniref:Amino acid-binding protein n=1 Tax=Vitreoscilla massiliensis TaxID=1689272 RepID=A0ABY4E5S6_9NEIS|nr:hypothetical protein [Vitreoscilla massiliensis]UOO91117.1 amino acid-binding protein [Vitreoscilla massiliensis]
MDDIHVRLANHPGTLAQFGQLLGQAGISLEGGGVFATGDSAEAHFLVADGERAAQVLRAAGLHVIGQRAVLVRKLHQEQPGQLGKICARLAAHHINIHTMYSDHHNRLILVVDDVAAAAAHTLEWQA